MELNYMEILWHHSWNHGAPYTGLGILEDGRKVWFQRKYEIQPKSENRRESVNHVIFNYDKKVDNQDDNEEQDSQEENQENNQEDEKMDLLLSESNIDESALDSMLDSFERSYQEMRKRQEQNQETSLSSYYEIYSLNSFQITLAEDYQNKYREEVGYNKEHNPLLYKPIDMNNPGKMTCTSHFNPGDMTINLLGAVHINKIENLQQPFLVKPL